MICVLPGQSSAQTYHPLPDSNAVWIVAYGDSDCALANVPNSIMYYSFIGDTLIAGQVYSEVWRERVVNGCNFIGSGYAGAIRNDTIAKQVMLVPPDSTNEQLLFDFSAEVGDTIHAYRGGSLIETQVVATIDSVLILGSYRRQWNLINDLGEEEHIIEGVGSTTGFVERINYVDSETYLNCLSVDSAALYEDQPGSCSIHYGLEELPTKARLNLYPNPATGSITIRTEPGMDKSDLHVLDLSGRLVLSLTLRGTEQKIDVSNLSPGMYAVDLRANGIPLALGELIIE